MVSEKGVLSITYMKETDLPTVVNNKSSLGEIFSSDDDDTFDDVDEPKESGFSLLKGVVSKTFNMFFPFFIVGFINIDLIMF